MERLAARRVLLPNGLANDQVVLVDDGLIVGVEPTTSAPDRTLVPGFIDIQVNGIDDIDVAAASGSDWERLDRLLVAQGVTTWCPTLVSSPLAEYDRPLRQIEAAMCRPLGARPSIAGVHLEGPFLGAAPGAHRRRDIIDIDLTWLAGLPNRIAIVTLGAEQPLAAAATTQLTGSGVVVAVGHSMANEAEFGRAVNAGATLVTHLFNAMSGLHHRSPGVAAFAITDSRVVASLIADGVHVHPRMVQLAFRALGPGRCVLVTDAVAWKAGTAGSVRLDLVDGAPRLADGTLAGSALTMDAAIRNCVRAGIEVPAVVQAATATPAGLLGLHDRGRIEPGRRADMVELDDGLRVRQVWIGGEATR